MTQSNQQSFSSKSLLCCSSFHEPSLRQGGDLLISSSFQISGIPESSGSILFGIEEDH